MGRKRIHIAKITSDKRRRATFTKRRKGLLKKAMELSILCECEVAVFIMAKDETSVYTTNGDPTETVGRALATGPLVTHNGMYEQLYFGADDDDSLDDFEGDDEVSEPTGGSLTSRATATRAKRKREQMLPAPAPSLAAETKSPAKRRAPAPSDTIKPVSGTHSVNQPPASFGDASPPSAPTHAATQPANAQTSALLQQMAILSQLLAQQSQAPSETGSNASVGFSTSHLVSQMSNNLMGALKQSVEQFDPSVVSVSSPSPSSTPQLGSALAHASNTTNAIPSGAGNSPLMPIGEISPTLAGISPHFPFISSVLTPPVIPSALTPPPLDGHILDVNFSGSPARDIPSFHDLTGRFGGPGKVGAHSLDSPISLSAPSTPAQRGNHRGAPGLSLSTGDDANGPGLGLRVSVPVAPRVFNIPPHLMSSTAPPTNGLIHANSNQHSESATNHTNQTNANAGNGTKADKFAMPQLSSMQPPAFPFASPHGLPSQSATHNNNSNNSEWPALPSPLVGPSGFNLYSPFLYSPRI